MSKNKTRFIIILVILFVVFSLIAFVVPFRRTPAFWISYVFAVIAIAVQAYAWPKAFGGDSPRSKFYGFPIARVSTIYLVVQLVVSLIFMGVAKWVPAWPVVLVGVVLLAAAAVGSIAADAIRDEVERQDTVLKTDVCTMRTLQSKAALIASQCEDAETKKTLDRFADALRYSDPVSSEPLREIEANLTALTDELQNAVLEKDYAAASALCARAEATLADRNRLCKLNK